MVSTQAAALVASIVNGNIPHIQARGVMIGMIDALARLSGNREVFWLEMYDLVDAVNEQLESSTEIH